MFEINKYIDLDGFKKIGYINNGIKLDVDRLSHILEMNQDLLSEILNTGSIPKRLSRNEKEESYEKIYLLLVLLNYVLKMAGHDFSKIKDFWINTSFFDSAFVKPPWYIDGLNLYLLNNKMDGLVASVNWIAEN